jgi:hypothetical protein
VTLVQEPGNLLPALLGTDSFHTHRWQGPHMVRCTSTYSESKNSLLPRLHSLTTISIEWNRNHRHRLKQKAFSRGCTCSWPAPQINLQKMKQRAFSRGCTCSWPAQYNLRQSNLIIYLIIINLQKKHHRTAELVLQTQSVLRTNTKAHLSEQTQDELVGLGSCQSSIGSLSKLRASPSQEPDPGAS